MQYPSTVLLKGGRIAFFDMVAPITLDGVYKHVDNKGNVTHAIIPNPNAAEAQAAYLAIRR